MDHNSQILQTLKNMESMLSRQKSIENLLERVVQSMEAVRDSNLRMEQMMSTAWKSYYQAEAEIQKRK